VEANQKESFTDVAETKGKASLENSFSVSYKAKLKLLYDSTISLRYLFT
jgi:hypothetical protein